MSGQAVEPTHAFFSGYGWLFSSGVGRPEREAYHLPLDYILVTNLMH